MRFLLPLVWVICFAAGKKEGTRVWWCWFAKSEWRSRTEPSALMPWRFRPRKPFEFEE